MTALLCQNPKTVSINATNYRWGLSVQSGINSVGVMVVSGAMSLQRCQFNDDGTCVDDPTPGSSQVLAFGDLNQFAAENPTIAAAIGQSWSDLNSLVDAVNTLKKLV